MADTQPSFGGPQAYNMPGPEYLASYLLIFLVGLTVASSSVVRSQIFNLVPKSPKEAQSFKAVDISAVKDSSEPEMLDRYEIMKKFDKDTWQRKAYDAFAAKLGDKEKIFPCIYASKGWKDNDLIYMFLPSEDCTERTNVLSVARAILAYHPRSHRYGANTSLVVLTPNSKKKRTIEDYHKLFWTFCNNRWCMCFDGKPAFMAVLTPAHEKRQSRYLPYFCFAWQPRWVFELLLTSDEKRAATLKNVRGLIEKYDYPLPHSPDIANFGEPGSSESKEYFIWDENRPATAPWPTLLAP